MTKTQVEILERIAALPEAERRDLIEQIVALNTGGESFYAHMTPEERAALAEGIAEAERGETISAEELRARMMRRFGFDET